MQHLLRNSIFTAIVLVVCLLAIFPMEKNLRLGKDLRGGSTLTYSVQIAQNEDEGEVISRVIDVLMERVNPNGLYEISMVRQGRDRLEITMPMPSDRVKELRDEFQAELDRLRELRITSSELDRALRETGADRDRALGELAGGNDARRAMLDEAATAWDLQHEIRAEYEALDETTPEDVRDEVIGRLAHAENEFEDARDEALSSTVDPASLRQILTLDDRGRKVYNEQSGAFVDIPSPRAAALQSLRDSAPVAVPDLDQVLEAFDNYERERTTLDDPQDLVRMLKGAGVLSFRVAVDANGAKTHPDEDRLRRELQENGPNAISATDARWYPLHKLDGWYRNWADYQAMQENPAAYFEQYGGGGGDSNFGYVVEAYSGVFYMLCWDSRNMRMVQGEGGEWSVSSAYPAQDQLGRPAVGFRMDATGARLLRDLTADHVSDAMAVLLDDRVYTAPNINEPLSTNAIIQGEFTPDEIDYLMRTLSSGSLQAKLSPEPISVTTVGPDLGVDNLKRGLRAGIIALVAVSIFMLIYYFYFGAVAVICLLCSAVMILGAMALNRASFTLPGIAGVILTFGMAVDANVLIYERIREELRKGKELKIAARIGYQKAMSSIVDGNVTNLIVCFVLGYTGTQEIKGFAITLGIGVVATLFSALLVARILMVFLIERIGFRGWNKRDMLPMVVTPIERLLEPAVKWMRLRWLFRIISAIAIGIGILMVVTQGNQMLDTEFRGGTQVIMRFKEVNGNEVTPIKLKRQDVQDRVRALEPEDDEGGVPYMNNADILPINPDPDGVTSDWFMVKTLNENEGQVREAIQGAFADVLATYPPLSFEGASIDPEDVKTAPAYPVTSPRLADVINRPDVLQDVSDFQGGVAIVIEDISPAVPVEQIVNRVATMRNKADFSSTLSRTVDIRPLTINDEDAASAVVVLVNDPAVSFFESPEAWNDQVASREWALVTEALTETSTEISVQSFSAAVASTFRAQAAVAVGLSFLLIMIYIWVRFGSARYSLAAIVTLLHDVLIAIGLIALAEIAYEHDWTQSLARAIGVQPFKIDLTLVAAILTIIGYSLNDTIIIMDRIRENRGKLDYATDEVIEASINQTISRTVITSGTTFVATLILYLFGGEGIRAFSYALLIGIVIGTYSSIAVAAPWVRARGKRFERLESDE